MAYLGWVGLWMSGDLRELRHRCGIFCLGWFMDVGRSEGVAPSMWAFPAGFWRMSGSCPIYVPKRQLDVEKKKWGKPAQKIAKNMSCLGT